MGLMHEVSFMIFVLMVSEICVWSVGFKVLYLSINPNCLSKYQKRGRL